MITMNITPGSQERAKDMEEMFKGGKTLQEIGDVYGISRERVRQIIKKRGVCRNDGGDYVSRYEKLHGLERGEIERLRVEMPGFMRAFSEQKKNAGVRGIEWKLSLREWVDLWRGKYDKRGRGSGLVMCRRKDQGAYEVGNVFIASAVFNNTAYAIRKWHGIDIEDDPYYTDMIG